MRLPKLLGLAVGAVLLAGGGSALAVGSSASRGTASAPHPAFAGRPDVSGVAPAASALRDSSSDRLAFTTRPGAGPTSSTSAPAAAGRILPSGLSVPAGGAPLSSGLDPAAAPSTPAGAGRGPVTQLPIPTTGSLPAVAAMANDTSPDAVVMLSSPLSASELSALSGLKGLSRVETVDTGTVSLGGAPVVAFGVDPGTFRDVTPAASASSDQLWQYLAAGSLVSSYDMANDRSLKLGSEQTISPAASSSYSAVKGWLGAFASIGLPGVDLLVAHPYAGDLGLTPASGVVVAAPGLAGATLQSELQAALPNGVVELLHPDQLPSDLPGNVLGLTTRQKILAAALSRVGLPYVWGGAGPASFDCSGLVQWAFRQAGILMPRVAAEQFLTGDHIPLADAQAGDLLFWTYDPSDPGYVDHVAIYLGNGMMVVAPHTGTNVQVAPVPTDAFAGAVEVVLAQ